MKMEVPRMNVNWDSFQPTFCSGFSQLQHDGDFVDMTLAADGYTVKVHQNVVALASPYIKEMLKSIPCQNPVIFLNNLSHDMLCYILEYIYKGQVEVKQSDMKKFVKAAKDLSLRGLSDMNLPETQNDNFAYPKDIAEQDNIMVESQSINIKSQTEAVSDNQNIINFTTYSLDEISVLNKTTDSNVNQPLYQQNVSLIEPDTLSRNYNIESGLNFIEQPPQKDWPTDSRLQCFTANVENEMKTKTVAEFDVQNINTDKGSVYKMPEQYTVSISQGGTLISEIAIDPPASTAESSFIQYTVSNRGSLQMILNRYIYNIHHTSKEGKNRRWRCVDYRRKHCTAYMDTEEELIVRRKNSHSHPCHDEKILEKVKRKMVFTTIPNAEDKAKKVYSGNVSSDEEDIEEMFKEIDNKADMPILLE